MANGAKAAAKGVAAAGTALLALGASTAEYRAEQAKLVSAFEAVGSSAEQAKTTYNELFRVLGDSGQATEAANHLAKLTTEEKALAEWTNICQGVYATFGDSLPIEGLTEAVNHTANLGEVQGSFADALEWSGISADSFNERLKECSTIEERESLIRDTLNGLYNEAAQVYEKNNASVLKQNEAQARLQETTAKLGEAVAPVVTAFTNFASQALAAVVPHIQSLTENYMPQLTSLLESLSGALQVAFEWISQHKSLLAVMAGVITGIAVAIGAYNVVAAVKAAMDAAQVTTLWALVSAYAAQAAAMIVAIAPYLAVVAAIAAVIAIIVVCVKHWDTIKATVQKVWNSIKSATKEAVSSVISKFTELYQKATAKIESLKQAASDKFNSIKSSATEKINSAKQSVVNGFNGMVTSAKDKLSSIVSSCKSKFNEVKTGIKEKIDDAKQVVKDGLATIKEFFNNFSWKLPKPKLPHFTVTGGEAPWGFMGQGSLPSISVSWYAKGGIFDSPTLFGFGNGMLGGLGEAGAEAIVPLENNLGWLDKIAAMLSERMGVNTPIVLNVDGKVFAETAISTINRQTRQTGRLALNLV